ncbi:MAG: pseudouridine synthase [Candidatus Merdivicinus sp.]|jgi:23S rRNA pseudouridine2605 synthase
MEIRLQKIIAESGFCSRRKAEELIAEHRVRVNGRPAQVGQKADPNRDVITIDGEKLDTRVREELVYYMLNKPRGYLTAMSDDRGRRCVSELVADIPQRVFPVGRLDLTSEGLLLFTNDGNFANEMTHPSHQVPKTYRVTVHSEVSGEQQVRLTEGVELDGVMTNPAEVRIITEEPNRTVMLITITEGRNREIRRMCEAVGLEVARLKRIAVGPIRLGMLRPGEYRELSTEELEVLRRLAQKGAARNRGRRQ